MGPGLENCRCRPNQAAGVNHEEREIAQGRGLAALTSKHHTTFSNHDTMQSAERHFSSLFPSHL